VGEPLRGLSPSVNSKGTIIPNSLSTHIAAVVSVAVAAIAAVHPGFKINATDEAVVVSVATSVAGLLELFHVNTKALVLKYAHELDLLKASVAAKVPAPIVAAAETVGEVAVKQAESVLADSTVSATATPSTAPPVTATAEPSAP
jgi:hypothetical protein